MTETPGTSFIEKKEKPTPALVGEMTKSGV